MMSEVKLKTKVLPGKRIEVTDPGLVDGESVEITIAPYKPMEETSILEFLNSLPEEPRLYKSPADVDRYLQQERDSWDR